MCGRAGKEHADHVHARGKERGEGAQEGACKERGEDEDDGVRDEQVCGEQRADAVGRLEVVVGVCEHGGADAELELEGVAVEHREPAEPAKVVDAGLGGEPHGGGVPGGKGERGVGAGADALGGRGVSLGLADGGVEDQGADAHEHDGERRERDRGEEAEVEDAAEDKSRGEPDADDHDAVHEMDAPLAARLHGEVVAREALADLRDDGAQRGVDGARRDTERAEGGDDGGDDGLGEGAGREACSAMATAVLTLGDGSDTRMLSSVNLHTHTYLYSSSCYSPLLES